VIEGVALLPWFQAAAHSAPLTLGNKVDCMKCKASHDQTTRQSWGCGYEVANPAVPVVPWDHVGRTGPRPSTCAGYTTNLPEVIEVARLFRHWSKGSIDSALRGDEFHEHTQQAIEIFEGAVSATESYLIRARHEGGS
jgi:hypothetical protein